ncbi:MAG: LppX_LprAFG lipoprotein, partial [Acidimicrobiia bacterium]
DRRVCRDVRRSRLGRVGHVRLHVGADQIEVHLQDLAGPRRLAWRAVDDRIRGAAEAADLLGLESLDGTDAYHLRGDVQGERVAVITAGLAGEQPITVDLWVDPGSGFVLRIEFATSAEAGQTDWSIRLSEFGEPVEVEPPI